MRRALITGLSGFTGKYLAAELNAAGFEVFGTTLPPQPAQKNLFSVNLCDLETLRKVIASISPDVVAHLAAISFVGHDNAEEIYQTNIVGTRNTLQALAELEQTPESVLLVSSANVYGNASDDPITEAILPNPENDYAVSKLAMEYMANTWLDKLPIFIVRPFNYAGVGQSLKFLLPKIVNHFRHGTKEINLGNIDISRDFSDVRTVAESYRKLIELAPTGKTINVCSSESVTLREILKIMADIAGYAINVQVNPAFVRANEIKRLRGSNQLLSGLIGNIDQIPLRKTLLWMYRDSIN